MENNELTNTSNTENVNITRAEYDSLKAYISELETQNRWLMEQMKLLKKKQFGSSSEKASPEVLEQMSLLFNEAELVSDIEKKSKTTVKEHTRAKRSGSVKDIIPEDIPVEEIIHELPTDERICPKCGEELVVIGTEVHESLKIKPAEAILKRDIYYTYGCRNCEKNSDNTPIVKAPKDPVVIPGGFASPEAVAYVAIQKFVMGAPLYRQEMEWARSGLKLTRQTMSNWLLYCAERWLAPVYDELHRQLLTYDLLHADETELQVLHENGKSPQSKSYMWLYRTSGDAKHPIVLYEYDENRSGEHPKTFLEGFHGYLQTDGYSGYNCLKDVVHIGCFAHVRRKFEEAVSAQPKGKRSPTAEQGVAYCSKLFKLEQEYDSAQLTYEERKQQRLERSKPVLDAMLSWAETRNATPKSKLGIALTYLKNQWIQLNNYLLDGRIELSNNRAERSIKPFVMSRKNFLFSNTPSGARSSAIIFSLIETAKENKLDPYRYLNFVLTEAPRLSLKNPDWPALLTPEHSAKYCFAKTE